ncbi:MAG: preprotein translocase subunit SecG [Phycisphaerales bacterium]|nr:MAG: preprotein translocase subunit SecG [Phycisphaerales bacterium]
MKSVAVLFVVCSLALILIVLMQKGRGGGLSAAFGGGAASGLLGSKTGDFLTWVTIVLVGLFLSLAVVMARFYKPTISDFGTAGAGQQGQPVQAEGEPGVDQPFQADDFREAVQDTNVTPDFMDSNTAADANAPGG